MAQASYTASPVVSATARPTPTATTPLTPQQVIVVIDKAP